MLIQYKIYHTTNLYTLQSNLLLERYHSNGFASSPLFIPYSEKSPQYSHNTFVFVFNPCRNSVSWTPYFVATSLFCNPFYGISFYGAIFLKKTYDKKPKTFVTYFLPENRIKRSKFRTFQFWPKC